MGDTEAWPGEVSEPADVGGRLSTVSDTLQERLVTPDLSLDGLVLLSPLGRGFGCELVR